MLWGPGAPGAPRFLQAGKSGAAAEQGSAVFLQKMEKV